MMLYPHSLGERMSSALLNALESATIVGTGLEKNPYLIFPLCWLVVFMPRINYHPKTLGDFVVSITCFLFWDQSHLRISKKLLLSNLCLPLFLVLPSFSSASYTTFARSEINQVLSFERNSTLSSTFHIQVDNPMSNTQLCSCGPERIDSLDLGSKQFFGVDFICRISTYL